MQPSILGVGIIGAGGIVRRHADAYRSLPQLARLVAVADIDYDRAAALKREYRLKDAYSDYRDLLARDDIQVVSICTPPSMHTPIVIDALAAGKHTLCEKPIARTLEGADQAIQAAERYSNIKLSYVYQYRSDPTHARIRHLIQQEELGRILMADLRVRAKRTSAYYASRPGRGSWVVDGGGVLINQAVHQLDSLISFLGSPIELSAVMNTFLKPTQAEDSLVGWIEFEGGAFATVSCTVCAHDDWFAIDILGENAQTKVAGNPNEHYCSWTVESKSSAVKRALWNRGHRLFPDLPTGPGRTVILSQKLLCKLRGRDWLPPTHWGHTPHVKDFLEAIHLSKPVPVPPCEARRSLELAVALYAAAISHKNVRLPIDRNHCYYSGIQLERAHAGS